jgi:hypothetical protein
MDTNKQVNEYFRKATYYGRNVYTESLVDEERGFAAYIFDNNTARY